MGCVRSKIAGVLVAGVGVLVVGVGVGVGMLMLVLRVVEGVMAYVFVVR